MALWTPDSVASDQISQARRRVWGEVPEEWPRFRSMPSANATKTGFSLVERNRILTWTGSYSPLIGLNGGFGRFRVQYRGSAGFKTSREHAAMCGELGEQTSFGMVVKRLLVIEASAPTTHQPCSSERRKRSAAGSAQPPRRRDKPVRVSAFPTQPMSRDGLRRWLSGLRLKEGIRKGTRTTAANAICGFGGRNAGN
jgi:hypothetical protein